MDITREDAHRIVQERIDEFQGFSGGEELRLAVLPDATIEKETYFVVFYQTEDYKESCGDEKAQLAGNAPFIVDKATGDLYPTGTACSIDVYMVEYEAGRIMKEEG